MYVNESISLFTTPLIFKYIVQNGYFYALWKYMYVCMHVCEYVIFVVCRVCVSVGEACGKAARI